ncbi:MULTISPECIES: cyanase [unclassified Microbacterium]|uniref:cyanase n=1 Tax=unclassified Microbacterium TaxID=2609290 RepID=UPI00386CE488
MTLPSIISKQAAGAVIDEIRRKNGMSWQAVSDLLGTPPVWTAAAVLGMHAVPDIAAARLGDALGLDTELVDALTRQPNRAAEADLSTDPTIYRFHELVQVYGPALKALIHDQFGDGIMSAINCSITLDRVPHPDGDRVVITIDGKFLPYAWVSGTE